MSRPPPIGIIRVGAAPFFWSCGRRDAPAALARRPLQPVPRRPPARLAQGALGPSSPARPPARRPPSKRRRPPDRRACPARRSCEPSVFCAGGASAPYTRRTSDARLNPASTGGSCRVRGESLLARSRIPASLVLRHPCRRAHAFPGRARSFRPWYHPSPSLATGRERLSRGCLPHDKQARGALLLGRSACEAHAVRSAERSSPFPAPESPAP